MERKSPNEIEAEIVAEALWDTVPRILSHEEWVLLENARADARNQERRDWLRVVGCYLIGAGVLMWLIHR